MATLLSSARRGDRLATLTALRDTIARTIQNCDSGRDIAALSKRLMEVMDEIEQLKPPEHKEPTPLDRAKAKRNAP